MRYKLYIRSTLVEYAGCNVDICQPLESEIQYDLAVSGGLEILSKQLKSNAQYNSVDAMCSAPRAPLN